MPETEITYDALRATLHHVQTMARLNGIEIVEYPDGYFKATMYKGEPYEYRCEMSNIMELSTYISGVMSERGAQKEKSRVGGVLHDIKDYQQLFKTETVRQQILEAHTISELESEFGTRAMPGPVEEDEEGVSGTDP